mgnify:CR=1 FL=1
MTKDVRTSPHLLYILADDFGYYDVSWKNKAAKTPNLDALREQGMDLDRLYAYQFCSPTRCSLLSGRLPIHVNTQNHPASKPGGVDLRMTVIGEKMKAQGYATAVFGKWHGGAHVEGQLPHNRGFDSSLGFLNGNEDHYTHYFGIDSGYDMWANETNMYDNSTYGGTLYRQQAVNTILNFNASAHAGLFLYLAFQNTHAPYQVPVQYEDPKISAKGSKRTFYGMATFLDETIGNVTQALHDKGLWDDTLIVFSADNGGEISGPGGCR